MGRQGSRTAMAEVETQTDVATSKMNLNCETLNTEESKIRTRILCQLLKDLPFLLFKRRGRLIVCIFANFVKLFHLSFRRWFRLVGCP